MCVCVDVDEYHWPVLSMVRESLLLLSTLLFLMEAAMAGLASEHRGHLPNSNACCVFSLLTTSLFE